MPPNARWRAPIAATGGDIIPFPVRGDARARPGLEQVRFHIAVLDRELQDLATRDFRSAGEWARRAAVPIVRTDCIAGLLTTATATRLLSTADEHRIGNVCDQLRSALSDTARSLARLGHPVVGLEERREVLQELPLHRVRHQRILGRLDELIDESGGPNRSG